MKTEFCDDYAALDREHWWWSARRSYLRKELSRLARGRTDLAILDVGCGDGFLFDELSAFGDVHGVEHDSRMLAGDSPHAERIHVGAFDESFQPQKEYDLILMLDVVEHMDDRAQALGRARELLAPGGKLVLTVPAFQALWTQHDVLCEHRLRYTRDGLQAETAAHGFQVEQSRYFFHWMFAAKLTVRALEAMRRPEPRSPRLLPKAANQVLGALCRTEATLFGWLGLPFGSSLFMVCRPVNDG